MFAGYQAKYNLIILGHFWRENLAKINYNAFSQTNQHMMRLRSPLDESLGCYSRQETYVRILNKFSESNFYYWFIFLIRTF